MSNSNENDVVNEQEQLTEPKKKGLAAMSNDSIGKTFIVAFLLCLVCSVLVSVAATVLKPCLLYTSPSPRDQRGSRMPSSA